MHPCHHIVNIVGTWWHPAIQILYIMCLELLLFFFNISFISMLNNWSHSSLYGVFLWHSLPHPLD